MGVDARFGDGYFTIRWNALQRPELLDCRYNLYDVAAADFSNFHEATRAWSPFNFNLNLNTSFLKTFRCPRHPDRAPSPTADQNMDTLTLVGVIVIAVFSITSHEAAHGFAADRLGDPTAREQGRLTLNPIPHIDLFFTILLPLSCC
jgi:hypothetical protein